METIVEYAQKLVYRLLYLMPSQISKSCPVPCSGCSLKLKDTPASTYADEICQFVESVFESLQLVHSQRHSHHASNPVAASCPHLPHPTTPLRVVIDLTSLEKCSKFLQMSTPTEAVDTPDLWVTPAVMASSGRNALQSKIVRWPLPSAALSPRSTRATGSARENCLPAHGFLVLA